MEMITIDMQMPERCDDCRFCVCEYTDDNKPESYAYCCAAEKFIAQACDGTDKVVCTAVLTRETWCPLQSQEPRVMTLEEIDALEDGGLVYIECAYSIDGQRKTVIKPAIYQADNSSPEEDGYYCIVSTWAQSGFYSVDSYGIDWRCWTSQPTPEQREAASWQ